MAKVKSAPISAVSLFEDDRSEFELRKEFGQLHSKLRDLGLNPVEALSVVSEAISGNPDKKFIDAKALKFLSNASPKSVAAAFQTFLTDDLRTSFGQYLTPQPVADHVSDLVNADLKKGSTVLDPFGGSGILLEALHAVRSDLKFSAIEINPSAANVAKAISKAADMNIDVRVGDAFDHWLNGKIEKFDAVVMNPPFGSKLVTLNSDALSSLPDFEGWGDSKNPPVELIALELSVSVVKPGGLVAAVLPQSVLTNRSFSSFRKGLFSKHKLIHVTSLPEATFGPFKGVAKACVCLIRVGESAKFPYQFSVRNSKYIGYDETGRKYKENDLVKPDLLSQGSIDLTAHVMLNPKKDNGNQIILRLGDHADIFRGRNPKDADYIEGTDGPFLLKVGSLSGSMLSWKRRKRTFVTSAFYKKAGDKVLKRGDVCLTAAAHKPRYVGLKVDLVDSIPEKGAVPSAELLVIRSKDAKLLPPEVILFYLRSIEGYSRIQEMVRGSTAHLYPSDLENLEVIIDLSKKQTEVLIDSFAKASEAHRLSLELQAKAYEAAGLEPFFSPVDED
jgi:type I restriction enzyme M protein